MTRISLPNRRPHELFTFEHWGQKFHVGVGYVSLADPITEMWINVGKTGDQIETLARDSAVILSLALQHGTPLEPLRKAIMRDMDGRPSGPIGKLLDILCDLQQQSAAVSPTPPNGNDKNILGGTKC